jgi:hypothetical protein
MTSKKWHVVADEYNCGKAFSISLSETIEGWDTESGNIGLDFEVCKYICDVLNKDIENCPFEWHDSEGIVPIKKK